MNGDSIVVDTNIVLYLLNGDKTLATLLNERRIYVSFITELELLGYIGLSAKDKLQITSFLSACQIIDITPHIKEKTVFFRNTYSLKLPDSIIAATSLFLGIPFITSDKAFSKIKELDLILYEK
jgi:predicted nucleic acid-binding protein